MVKGSLQKQVSNTNQRTTNVCRTFLVPVHQLPSSAYGIQEQAVQKYRQQRISGKNTRDVKTDKGCKSETFLATPANLIDLAEHNSSLELKELSDSSDLKGQKSSLELKSPELILAPSELRSLSDPNERDF